MHEAVAQAPKLIPLFAHRFLLGDPPRIGNGVLSVYQTDIIEYGADLRFYLLHELYLELGLDPREVHDASSSASRHDWGESRCGAS